MDAGDFLITRSELESNQVTLGPVLHKKVIGTAKEQYLSLSRDNKLIPGKSSSQVFPSFEKTHLDHNIDSRSGAYFSKMRLALFRAVYRANVAIYWVFAVLALMVGAAIDGLQVRKISAHDFGYQNPTLFNVGSHAIILLNGLLLLLFFVPFPVGAYGWIGLAVTAPLVVWVTVRNFQTGAG